MLVRLYRTCLKYEIHQHRGGTRVLRILQRLIPPAAVASIPVQVPNSPPVYVNLAQPSGHDVALLARPTEYEPHVQAIFRALVEPTDVAVDIGANLGRHTIVLDALAGRVHAVEPNPALIPNLRRTAAGLRHTQVHGCALGEHTGSVSLVFPVALDHSQGHVSDEPGDIPLKRLDDLIDTAIDFVKVDAEGAEAAIFRGGRQHFDTPNAPFVVFEELHFEQSASTTLMTFQQAGYQCWVIQRDGRLTRYEDGRTEWIDVLAIPARRLPFARARVPLG